MFNLPSDQNRLAVVGMTGTGKTHGALWHLSLRSWDSKPWIIIDYKRDENIARIPGLEIIDHAKRPPRQPGIYAIQPVPTDDENALVESFMWQVWEQEQTGIYIDEGYMIGRYNKALRALLTQGRSKRIPIIMLSQRPSWISPFLLSESEFLQMYYMHTPDDVKRMREWVPYRGPMPTNFHSIYYDVKENRVSKLAPMPKMSEILQRFQDRRPRPRRPWL